MRRKKSKGFTLIELLVVVAIIGILASVGVVAYSGYTASAKKGAAKSNHNSVKKWIQNELQKCNVGERTSMNGNLTCANRATEQTVVTAVIASLATNSDDMINPYGNADAVTETANTGCAAGNDPIFEGTVYVSADASANQIVIHTCITNPTGETGEQASDWEMTDNVNNAG